MELTDFEATRRGCASGEFLDLCPHCLATIMDVIDTSENFRLYDPTKDVVDFEADEPTTPVKLPNDDEYES